VSLAEDLDALEKSIRQLHIEWDKFFGGVERKPPVDLKTRVEAMIRRHAQGEIRNNAERFRYQTLTARYNTFSELWSKRLRALEEGRSIQGYRGAPPPASAVPPEAGRAAPERVRIQSTDHDPEAVRELYGRFIEARRQTGEGTAVKFDSFQKLISQQASKILSQKGALAVDFRLETRDGKVSLKAKIVR
jgi:hypothetical protein